MTQFVFTVLSGPSAGQEEEYNRWYDNQHLPDVVAVPQVVAAQRFRLADTAPDGVPDYLALYEIEATDIAEFRKELASRAGTEAMVMSDALDRAQVTTRLYTPITERAGESHRGNLLMLSFVNPVAGREQELHDWYVAHNADPPGVPGVLSAQRFQIVEEEGQNQRYRYLGRYDVETEDAAAFRAALSDRAGSEALQRSPALDREDSLTLLYRPLGERITTD